MKNENKMMFKEVDIHFLFTFSLPTIEITQNWEKIQKIFKTLTVIENKNNQLFSPPVAEDDVCLVLYTKDNFTPVEIQVKESSELNYFFCNETISYKFQFSYKIDLLINKYGAGSFDFTLKVKPRNTLINVRDSLFFLNLVDFKTGFSLSDENTTHTKFSELSVIFHDKLIQILGEKFAKIKSLKIDKLIDTQTHNSLINQNPYIVSELVLTKGTPHDYLKTKSKKLNEINFLDLESLLIRTYAKSDEGRNQIDSDYIGFLEQNLHKDLPNLYPFSHMYANIHVRSCLVIYGDYDQDTYLKECGSKYLLQLINTIKIIRMNWFVYYNLLERIDRFIDKTMKNYYNEFRTVEISRKEEKHLNEIFGEMMDLRSATVLTITDLTIFSHSAGSLYYVYNKFNEIYNMHNLVELLSKKAIYIKELYNDFVEMFRIKMRNEIKLNI